MFAQDYFSNETYLVTGSTSGIGRAVVMNLAKAGAKVVIHGRSDERANEVLEALPGGPHLVMTKDLCELDSLKDWLKEIVLKTGQLSGFVHSAGMHYMMPAFLQKPEQFEKIQRVNVSSGISIAGLLRSKNLRTKNCSVVFVASVMGVVGQPAVSAYAASKGALIAATRTLALEMAPDGLRVNSVSPGQVFSEMTQRQMEKLPKEQFNKIAAMHPLGIGTTDDVANAVLFLLARDSKWITGSNLIVDGGYTAA